jgi:BolA protein
MTSQNTLPTHSSWQPLMVEALQTSFQPSFLEVIDESAQHAGHAGANELGLNSHYRVVIASAHFEKLNRVQRHRLVYDSLREFLDNGLHALAIEFRSN